MERTERETIQNKENRRFPKLLPVGKGTDEYHPEHEKGDLYNALSGKLDRKVIIG